MELVRFGLDTVRVMYDLEHPLPMGNDKYRHELVTGGWSVADQLIPSDLGPLESRTARWQDPENSTLRCFVQNAGRTLAVEASIPRLLDDSLINTSLATSEEARNAVQVLIPDRLREVLPEFGAFDAPRWRRMDMTADIAAGAAYAGLIAAGTHFQIPRARKVARSNFPGETSRVSSPSITVRTYDKAREMQDKTASLIRKLDKDKRGEVMERIQEYRERGVARLEIAHTPKKNGISEQDVVTANLKWADLVESGYNFENQGGILYIGGLSKIRAEIDGRADLSSQTRSALLAFAVRYAELGEDGMQAAMSRATYYRHKKRFLESGLRLDDVTSYHGELDFRPVLKQVRGAS